MSSKKTHTQFLPDWIPRNCDHCVNAFNEEVKALKAGYPGYPDVVYRKVLSFKMAELNAQSINDWMTLPRIGNELSEYPAPRFAELVQNIDAKIDELLVRPDPPGGIGPPHLIERFGQSISFVGSPRGLMSSQTRR